MRPERNVFFCSTTKDWVKTMRARRGMELAVNTLVVIILGVVIVGGGILLISKIVAKASSVVPEVNDQTQQALFNVLLNSKQRIAALDNVQTAARNSYARFALAFQNQQAGQESTFTVAVDATPESYPNTAPNNADCGASPQNCPNATALPGPYKLPRYGSQAFYVLVNVPRSAPTGEYTFSVEVYNGTTSQRDNAHLYARTKVSVDVE